MLTTSLTNFIKKSLIDCLEQSFVGVGVQLAECVRDNVGFGDINLICRVVELTGLGSVGGGGSGASLSGPRGPSGWVWR